MLARMTAKARKLNHRRIGFALIVVCPKEKNDFSKAQIKLGQYAQCKECVDIANNPTWCCCVCDKPKTRQGYGHDQKKKLTKDGGQIGPMMCLACVVEQPRTCHKCQQTKPVDQFSTEQLRLPRNSCNLTLVGVKALEVLCLPCEKIDKEEKLKAQQAKEENARNVMKMHNVQFYQLPEFDNIHMTKTMPDNLEGTYDIFFHHGWCLGEDIENRTTKGTCKLWFAEKTGGEDDSEEEAQDDDDEDLEKNGKDEKELSGLVEFEEELRLSAPLCFQRDFTLSRGTVNDGSCGLRANLVDEEARDVVQCDEEECRAYLTCIDKRIACPWMKHEREEENENEGDIVKFETLEEAEALAEKHEKGDPQHWLSNHTTLIRELVEPIRQFCVQPPKPVLFLEPGDLMLRTEWSDDFREPVLTYCLLRRRNEAD